MREIRRFQKGNLYNVFALRQVIWTEGSPARLQSYGLMHSKKVPPSWKVSGHNLLMSKHNNFFEYLKVWILGAYPERDAVPQVVSFYGLSSKKASFIERI